MTQPIDRSIVIDAPREEVWELLTRPELMPEWLGEPEMKLEVETDWSVGSPIRIRGFHHAKFENRGTVLRFEPPTAMAYTHLSSISRLPEEPESYSTFEFELTPEGEKTKLRVRVTGFPTDSIYKHLEFYWRGTLGVIKRRAEAKPLEVKSGK